MVQNPAAVEVDCENLCRLSDFTFHSYLFLVSLHNFSLNSKASKGTEEKGAVAALLFGVFIFEAVNFTQCLHKLNKTYTNLTPTFHTVHIPFTPPLGHWQTFT